MRLIRVVLLCVFSVCFAEVNTEFGYISYQTTNIGDDIQAIAAKRLLPKNSIPVDRELISEFKGSSPLPTLVNGWYMHVKGDVGLHTFHTHKPVKSWPPSEQIDPLLISMHITRTAMEEMLTPEGVEYFKQYEPIGARDNYTMRELQKNGISSYFSGCLTLTLDNPYKDQREDVIYAVDISKECANYIRSKTKSRVIEITHAVPSEIARDHEARLRYAEMLLNKYRKAKCVVTSRLHCTMPCLAFETPVLFFGAPGGRFDGLADLVYHCSYIDFLNSEIDYDFEQPPSNPTDYLDVRESLIEVVSNWVQSKMMAIK